MQKNEINPGPKKILLSGGTGFLGSHMAKKFLESGDSVTILKRKSSNLSKISNISQGISLIDIESFHGGNFDTFINAASVYGRNNETEEEMISSNIDFPISILSKLNLDNLHLININTSLPAHLNLYSSTKHGFIKKVRSIYSKLLCTNLQVEQFYGPHDGTFVSFIVEKFKSDSEAFDLTLGEQQRDFIFFQDVVDAVYTVSQNPINSDLGIGTGRTVFIKDVVKLIAEELSVDIKRAQFGGLNYREREVMHSVADISKIKELGWEPQFDIAEGIKKTLSKW